MCDCGVVAAVVLGLGHGHLKGVQVGADHVGSQTRHFNHCFKFFYAFILLCETKTSFPSILSFYQPSVRKNLVTTVSVEGGSGLVNTGNRNVPGGETFYDGTLPKHTFQ